MSAPQVESQAGRWSQIRRGLYGQNSMGIDARAVGAMRAHLVPLEAVNPLAGAPQMVNLLVSLPMLRSQQVERRVFIW